MAKHSGLLVVRRPTSWLSFEGFRLNLCTPMTSTHAAQGRGQEGYKAINTPELDLTTGAEYTANLVNVSTWL